MALPTNFTQQGHFDDLIPVIAHVIEHARSLQDEAQAVVGSAKDATEESRRATKALQSSANDLESRLAKPIVHAVKTVFDAAIEQASAQIVSDLAEVKAEATAAVAKIKVSANDAVESIQVQANQVQERLLIYAGIGFVFGLLIGGLGMYLVLL